MDTQNPNVVDNNVSQNIQNNKKSSTNILIIILLLIVATGIGFLIYQNFSKEKAEKDEVVSITPKASKEVSPTSSVVDEITKTENNVTSPAPTGTEPKETIVESDLELIKKALADKNEWSIENVNVTVSKNTGTHASGGVTIKGEMGGAMFLAAKVDEEWVAVWDGNGTISCSSIEPYDFPTDMVEECWDESTGALKTL